MRWVLALLCLLALAAPRSPRAQPAPPAWAQDAVVYQLFPERFANGDPTNDPTWASLDFPSVVDSALWQPSVWTADWYARQPWETALGPDFYEHGVFFRRYGGDLQGVRDRLDHLDALGVTAVYFNPVFYGPSLHKYDAASYVHVDPFFGPDPAGDLAQIAAETDDPASWGWTSADRLFLDLVAEMHRRGMRVIVDGVFNHTGERFFAFQDVREKQQASRYAGWYEVTQWDDPATPDTSEFDWNGWYGFKPLPVFANDASDTTLVAPVRAHLFDATRRWMDPDGDGDPSDGVDGWRLDAAEQVPEAFWREWTALARTLNPEAWLIAEVWFSPVPYLAETGFASSMNYHGLGIPADAFLYDGRVPADTFAAQLADRFQALPSATALGLLNVLDSHDTDRLPSMIVNGGLGTHFDRDISPRSNPAYAVRAPTAAERELQRAVVTLQMALPGPPMLYYGDEAGMWGGDDPDDRKPMVWPDLTFADEALDPRGRPRTPDPVAFDTTLFAFYQEAVALRRSDAVLRRGDLRVLAADSASGSFAMERTLGAERRVVALNRTDESQFLPLPVESGPPTPLVPIFASSGVALNVPALVAAVEETRVVYGLRLPPRTAVVFRPAEPLDVRPRGLDE